MSEDRHGSEPENRQENDKHPKLFWMEVDLLEMRMLNAAIQPSLS